MTWVRRWNVTGSKGDPWTVAITDTGAWGCSCPKWKFAKKGHFGTKPDCHHIDAVRASLAARRDYAPSGRRPVRTNPLPAPMQGERRLDFDVGAADAPLPNVGERFRHLDYQLEVIA